MKKVLLSVVSLTLIMGLTFKVNAQNSKSKDNSEEIIIRKKNGKDRKLTIEMNGNEVLINGKPISEFKDDGVSIKTYRNKEGNAFFDHNTFMYTPRAGGGKNFNFWNDSNLNERRTFLGVTTEKTDDGVKITEVVEGSAAAKAGLKEGDLIRAIGDKKISEPDDIVNAIRNHKPKDEVKISYQRNGKAEDANAILTESKNLMSTFSFNNNGAGDHFQNFEPFAHSFLNAPDGSLRRLFTGNHKLGVRIEDVDEVNGAKITNVEENSAAEKAGLKVDDIITGIDGQKVKDVNEVRAKLMEVKDKAAYSVKATRNGSEMTFNVKIPKAKNQANL